MVNFVDGLGTKLDPLAFDENDGANFERQIRVEIQHNRGYFGDRGCIKCLPAVALDSEVEECIGGGETSFWDKRVIEQGLMIDPLGLPVNEPVWIFRGGWCRPRGGAGSLSFGRDQLPWSHGGRYRVRDLQTRERERKGQPNFMWGKN